VKKLDVISLLLATLLIVACSQDSEPLPRARDINVLIFANSREEAFIRAQIEDFQRFNWNAKVRLLVRPPDFSALAELERMESKGQPVDLLYFESRELPPLVAKAKLAQIGKDHDIRKISEGILPELNKKLAIKNEQYSLPFAWSTAVLVFNKKIFDGIGISYPSEYWGWPDVLESAQAAAMDTDRDGKIDQYGMEMQSRADEVMMMFWQFEGETRTDANSLTTLLNPENRLILDQTIDFYSDLQKGMNVATINSKGLKGGLFESGRAAVTFGQWSDVESLLQSNRRSLWQIAPAPRGRDKATVLEAKLFAVAQDSVHKTEAIALAQFFLRSEAQKLLLEEGVGLPVLTALNERTLTEGKEMGIDMQSFYLQLPDAQIAPQNIVMKEIQKVLDDRLSSGHKIVTSPEDKPSFRSRLKLRLESEKK